jgi:acyl-CoA synthetase (AMP-forming)/AMP-acid ligase II|mmetsp:Transcript_58016/g.92168  ORF Transcript_58016/g.92168 Transcript_58016/m.92168 type:complete len:571 (-) Transcript_58016:176-1888(-)
MALEKVTGVASAVWNMLPGGKFNFGKEKTHLPVPVRVFKTLPPFLGDEYPTYFTKHAEKEWVVYENERYTFKAAWVLIQAVVQELVHGMGVKPGDTVGIAMRNLPEFFFAFIAVQCAGGVAVPLNSLWKTEEFEYAVKDSACKIILGDAERLRRCQPFAQALGVTMVLIRPNDLDGGPLPEHQTTWEKMLEAGSSRPPVKVGKVGAEDTSMIMYTSGSTGFPKGVIHTQRTLGTMLRICDLGQVIIPAGNALLLAVPLFHITAVAGVFLRSLVCGSKIISMRKWDAGVALDLIEREKVSALTGVPTMMTDILSHPSFSKERIASIKSMAAAGAPVPPSQVKKTAEATGTAAAGQAYGLTEVIAATANTGKDYLARPTSCGKPLPLFVEVVIKDPATGKVLPAETRGEVCIRSAMVMKGYHNQPDKTAEVMDSEGFFHSGDIGRIDSAGFVYIMDRLKDIIIRGGENIDCSEVEAALYNHKSVKECSVFGLPDERLGEVVGAAVWCEDDTKPEELTAKAAETIAAFKVPQPHHIFILKEELPKGATGKLDKKGLRARFSEELANKTPMSKL